MKTTVFILSFLFFGYMGYSQVQTKIIQVDLSVPHKNSISICNDETCTFLDNSKWLSARCREMIAVKLINGNPFKYTYKIDTRNLSFFNDQNTTSEKVKKDAEAEALADKNKGMMEALHSESVEGIIIKNKELVKSIDSLDIEVKNLYEILKLKNVLVESDYAKREVFLKNVQSYLTEAYQLMNSLQNVKRDSLVISTEESLLKTKVKAEKSIDSIIEKFYTTDLAVYTLPIDVQGQNIDVVEFKLRRFDKETKEEDLNFASKPYNIWIKGGLKIDVSAGLFFTSLYDSEFGQKDDPAIPGNKIITLKNGGDYDLAFGSTINTYIRANSWIVPTLNFGAVITQNEKLQVLLGLGAILGKQERIIFSAGLTMGKVNRIADSYSVGGSYNLGNSGDVPTQSQFKFGHFFGITYNLTKVKKISLDKGIEQN
ncbi:hypothetical protein [Flavobacterium poyangense]|uniref:hypothetical protein n=1 Tax=Flavobacterium poyangense TaxID=2204302 RepID=UPI0014233A19|nr:hypothetical protein [Flavobacterium sp. JXAS1]